MRSARWVRTFALAGQGLADVLQEVVVGFFRRLRELYPGLLLSRIQKYLLKNKRSNQVLQFWLRDIPFKNRLHPLLLAAFPRHGVATWLPKKLL